MQLRISGGQKQVRRINSIGVYPAKPEFIRRELSISGCEVSISGLPNILTSRFFSPPHIAEYIRQLSVSGEFLSISGENVEKPTGKLTFSLRISGSKLSISGIPSLRFAEYPHFGRPGRKSRNLEIQKLGNPEIWKSGNPEIGNREI